MINKSNPEVIAIIEDINWDGRKKKNEIEIIGYSFFKDVKIASNSSIKKSLVIDNGKKQYYLPMNNTFREDISEKYQKNYNYSGFSVVIDLSFIDNMSPLSEGEWFLKINIINDSFEATVPLKCEDIPTYDTKEIKTKQNNLNVLLDLSLNISKDSTSIISTKHINSKEQKNFISSVIDRFIINNKAFKLFKNFIIELLKLIKQNTISLLYNTFKKLPLKENKVLFLSDSRSSLSGNFEFVYNELIKKENLEIKTILKNSITDKLSFTDKFSYLYNVATSKYILLDDFYPNIYSFKLRKETELIQLWHACGAFKTFGFSRLGKQGGPRLRSKNHRNYTKAIVSSPDLIKHYAEAFGISSDKVKVTGVPRTDIFFDESYKNKITEELYAKYPILKGKKTIMFAPTFRGNGQQTAYYDFDKLDLELLYENFHEEYIFIIKLHPFIKNIPTFDEKYSNFILDLTSEREINDLLFISDILITDYSSVCFEYSLLNRPMIFFAYDMEDYIEKRDFYYPFKSFVPGPIVKTTQEIVDIINNETYSIEKLEHFRTKFFSHFDGKSTQRVVEMILNEDNK